MGRKPALVSDRSTTSNCRLLAKVGTGNTKRILQDTVLRFVATMKRWHGSLSILLFCAGAAFSQSTAVSGLRSLHVDAGKVTGEIRSFQGLNGPPSPLMAGLPNLVQQYKDLRVNQVR